MPDYQHSLFIFRRDLRLPDNTGLIAASKKSAEISTVFFLHEEQTQNHDYFSANAFQFMVESLQELADEIKRNNGQLSILRGDQYQHLEQLLKTKKFDAVFVNQDYTPFARKRDQKIADICAQHNVAFHSHSDYLLIDPENALKADGTPYTVFTPFYRNAAKQAVRYVDEHEVTNFSAPCPPPQGEGGDFFGEADTLNKILDQKNEQLAVRGGRNTALKLLKQLNETYATTRDIPSQNTTSKLSAHHKFGTVSIRESFWEFFHFFGAEHTALSELYWRDFFTHIAWHFPHVFGQAFKPKYDRIEWKKSADFLAAWQQGRTGFPIVDAGMRELNATGFMHNRVRMITACFLVKDLQIGWREGEKYFAQKLVDYDPAVNNGNWQWAASTGCDAQPYFRIFNPWSQQLKFDNECEYIKQWIPELRDHSPKEIHNLTKHEPDTNTPPTLWENSENKSEKSADFSSTIYPQPIINHKYMSHATKEMYKKFIQ